MNFLRNRWLWILVPPWALFLVLMGFDVKSTSLLWAFSIITFMIVAYPFAKYFWRGTQLVWMGYTERQDFNIVGWAHVLLGLMGTQAYRRVWLSAGGDQGHATWLTQQYWNAACLYVMMIGFLLVAWSSRRVPPDVLPSGPGFGFLSLFVGFISGVGLMLSGVLPALAKALLWLVSGLFHAA